MPTQRGRYTLDVAQKVLDRLSNGEALTRICQEPDMPCLATIYSWIDKRPGFRHGYIAARAAAAEGLAAEALAAARDVTTKNAPAKRVLLNELHWQASRIEPRGPKAGEEQDDLSVRLEEALKRAARLRAKREGVGQ